MFELLDRTPQLAEPGHMEPMGAPEHLTLHSKCKTSPHIMLQNMLRCFTWQAVGASERVFELLDRTPQLAEPGHMEPMGAPEHLTLHSKCKTSPHIMLQNMLRCFTWQAVGASERVFELLDRTPQLAEPGHMEPMGAPEGGEINLQDVTCAPYYLPIQQRVLAVLEVQCRDDVAMRVT